LASIEDNTISETGETVSLEAVTIQEDPVFITTILDTASTSVGYLMYNAFQRNSHENLNDTFGTFQSEGIDELVLDLRYNSGGSAQTSQVLASMISGQSESDIYATYSFSSKRSAENETVSFLDQLPLEDGSEIPMNQLSLDRVFILTGFNTASASEVVINGLEPYMDVILIGRQTVGKDDGSLTLYDAPAPYIDKADANPNHKNAIQPIVLKIVNVDGRDYPNGFTPLDDNLINELDFLEDLPPLGGPEDPLLARALEIITGQPVAKAPSIQSADHQWEILTTSTEMKPYSNNNGFYIEPSQLKKPETKF
jgi:C-terminal processing protease CtpA/Prc